jgi:hypothetical protein
MFLCDPDRTKTPFQAGFFDSAKKSIESGKQM